MNTTPKKPNQTVAEFVLERGPHCLVLARHGETDWNAEGRLQGQRDVPLSNRGHVQATQAAQSLKNVPLNSVHSSQLSRCRSTAFAIAEANMRRPSVASSVLLNETALGVLEGELKSQQSTPELSTHYREFSKDEINYRIPSGGENLHDVADRVHRFFHNVGEPFNILGNHLIVGHRNVNKMIVRHLLGISITDGFRVEHDHQRLYFYFAAPEEFWSYCVATARFTRGYETIDNGDASCYG